MLRDLAGAVVLMVLLGGCRAADAFRYESRAKAAVAKELLDPMSAQFRNIALRNDHVCGEVNAKNSMGAYVGYRRFVVSVPDWNAQIDPQFDYSDLFEAEDLCSSMRSNEYSSVASTISACDRADEKRTAQSQQERFDSAWSANCRGTVHLPFQPPLTDNTSGPPEETVNTSDVNDLANDTENDAEADDQDGDEAAESLPDNAFLQVSENDDVQEK